MEIEDGPDFVLAELAESREISSPRFVLLRHEMPPPTACNDQETVVDTATPSLAKAAESHWDLMFEQPHRLLTYQLSELPEYRPRGPLQFVKSQRIADHRPLYLDYEGEVSGNRGRVWQVARGIYLAKREKGRTKVELRRGRRLATIWMDDCCVGESTQLEFWDWAIRPSGPPD